MSRYLDALAYVKDPALNGQPFDVGMCKSRTRKAFSVPSDGSVDAAEAWSRTRHRVSLEAGWKPAILWWLGGSAGHGHVAFTDPEPGIIWTVDYPLPGRWNRVRMTTLEKAWPGIRYAGASLDIDGVQVIPDPPKPSSTPQLDHAISDLTKARDARKPGPGRRKIRELLAALRTLKAGNR